MKTILSGVMFIGILVAGFTKARAQNANLENTALLIIDMQNDYFNGGKMPLAGCNEAALKAKQLLEVFRSANKPVIYIKHIATQPDATFFLPNTPGVEINTYVSPQAGEKVIVKHFPNSFRETTLLSHLKSLGVTNLVICGMMTDVCVVSTVRAAKDLSFNNIVISDACATQDRQLNGKTVNAAKIQRSYLAGMTALGSWYAKVKTAQQFINGQ